MELNYAKLIEMMKRAKKGPYNEYLLRDLTLLGCFDPDDDDDNGLHHIIYLNEEVYAEDFWKLDLVMDIDRILNTGIEYQKDLLEIKREKKLKPKEAYTRCSWTDNKVCVELTFEFVAEEKVMFTSWCTIKKACDDDYTVQKAVTAYTNMAKRSCVEKRRGVTIDGILCKLFDKTVETSEVLYLKVPFKKDVIMVPLMKSFFHSIKEPDEFNITVHNTTIDRVYLYTIMFLYKGIAESWVGYLQNFDEE